MMVDAAPAFYLEHLKRLRKHGIQPYFVPAHVHQIEIIERLIRAGIYMGPMNMAIAGYGGGTIGRNPFDWMEVLRRMPQGAVVTFWSSMRGLISLSAMALVLGQHVRVGNEDNLWGADRQRLRRCKQVEGAVRICKEFGRKVATAEEARKIMKVGVWYDSVEETLRNLGLPPNRNGEDLGFRSGRQTGRKQRRERQRLASHRLLHGAAGPDRRPGSQDECACAVISASASSSRSHAGPGSADRACNHEMRG